MTKLFIPSSLSFVNIKELIEHVETLNIAVENTAIGNSFDDFLQTLNKGDLIIVQSLDFFPSLIELLAKIAELQEREITLRSIEEPWLSEPVENTADFLEKLRTLAVKMHARRTNLGLQKARTLGKTLGRVKGQKGRLRITDEQVAQVETLRREQKLSLVAACRQVGCSPNSYHTYLKRQE